MPESDEIRALGRRSLGCEGHPEAGSEALHSTHTTARTMWPSELGAAAVPLKEGAVLRGDHDAGELRRRRVAPEFAAGLAALARLISASERSGKTGDRPIPWSKMSPSWKARPPKP